MSKSILKDIYEGKNANGINLGLTPDYQRALDDYDELLNDFISGLTEKQKEDFDKLYDMIILAESEISSNHYQEGLKLGLKIGVEVFKE